MFVPLLVLPLAAQLIAASDALPKLDVTPSCRGAARAGYVATTQERLQSCIDGEHRTRDQLAKDNYRATMTAILLTLTVIRGVGYFAVGEFSREVWIVTAILFPSMLLGMFIGNRFHHTMSDLAFRRTVACALTVSGLALLIK